MASNVSVHLHRLAETLSFHFIRLIAIYREVVEFINFEVDV